MYLTIPCVVSKTVVNVNVKVHLYSATFTPHFDKYAHGAKKKKRIPPPLSAASWAATFHLPGVNLVVAYITVAFTTYKQTCQPLNRLEKNISNM